MVTAAHSSAAWRNLVQVPMVPKHTAHSTQLQHTAAHSLKLKTDTFAQLPAALHGLGYMALDHYSTSDATKVVVGRAA